MIREAFYASYFKQDSTECWRIIAKLIGSEAWRANDAGRPT